MPLTFGDLRTEILGWLDESTASTTTSTYLNVTAALKQAHVERLTNERWKFMLWPRTETLTTVASQQAYSLHQAFLRPFWIRNTTRKTWLTETPGRNIEPSGIELETDTDTDRFVLGSRSAVSAQPTSASVITIVSSSASDTGVAKAVTIWGDTASGMTTETITPNGTVAVAGVTAFTQILGVTKASDWTGTLTLTSNSGAVTNLSLFPTEDGRSYLQLELLYLPTGSETISYRFYRIPREIGSAGDLTDIPPPFERVLVYDTLLMLGAYDNRLDGGRAGLWREMRDRLDLQMRDTYMEGQTLGAEARYIGSRDDLSGLASRHFPS